MTTPAGTNNTTPITHGGWIFGTVLIALGAVFLLQNAGIPILRDNWWALFILIPALATFSAAWAAYQQSGQVTPTVTGLVVGGSVPLVIALVFLFGLSFGQWWPLLLIGAGIAALLGGGVGRRHRHFTQA
jgi:hypothetical protein